MSTAFYTSVLKPAQEMFAAIMGVLHKDNSSKFNYEMGGDKEENKLVLTLEKYKFSE